MAAAEAANAGGHWESAVSRAYYAVYHLVVEVLAVKRRLHAGRWQHDTVASRFYQEFCWLEYLFAAQDDRVLQELLDARHAAAYRDERFDERKTARLLRRARGTLRQAGAEV